MSHVGIIGAGRLRQAMARTALLLRRSARLWACQPRPTSLRPSWTAEHAPLRIAPSPWSNVSLDVALRDEGCVKSAMILQDIAEVVGREERRPAAA